MNRAPVYLHQLGIVCAAGSNGEEVLSRVQAGDPDCLTMTRQYSPSSTLPLGVVNSTLAPLDSFAKGERSRCNQLLKAAMDQLQPAFEQARQSVPSHRIGIVLGTSTSGIAEGELAIAQQQASGAMPTDYQYSQQEMSAPVDCLAGWLGVTGPAYVISTACSSSAKALASARRLLRMGACDLVIAGGVDSLCQLTVNGFMALDSVSSQRCQPFSQSRDGINIGEGAALFMLSREPGPVTLAGVGECSDAHHISAPEPNGLGAAMAMQLALADADVQAEQIGYVNLHGTATPQNDKMESLAVANTLGCETRCSSTKPYTGHSLGAAGAIEAAICWLTLTQPQRDEGMCLPPHLWDETVDPELAPISLTTKTSAVEQLDYVMSNSFAFGGNNISLILGAGG